MADVTPGTTSKGMFSSLSARTSSPPLPKTKGSPPLSLTTFFPSNAFATRIWLISSCVILRFPTIFPTLIRSQVSSTSSKSL